MLKALQRKTNSDKEHRRLKNELDDIEQGLLRLVGIDLKTEADALVNFSQVMDDGVAITGAIAFHRNWAIATDDKVAMKFFSRKAPICN